MKSSKFISNLLHLHKIKKRKRGVFIMNKGKALGIGSIIAGVALAVFGVKKVTEKDYICCECCREDDTLTEEDIEAVDR